MKFRFLATVLTALSLASTACAGDPWIFSGNYAKSLKSQLNLFDQAYILNGTSDPSSVAALAPQGSLFLLTGGSGGASYLKQDAGSTTNWTMIGSRKYAFDAQNGAAYTLTLADGYSRGTFPLVTMSNAAAQTLTVPPNSSVAFPVGERVEVLRGGGAGTVAIQPGAGVTFNSADGTIISSQYGFATLIQTAADVWTLVGAHLSPLMMITCTSCTSATDGNYKVLTFTVSDTAVVTMGTGTIASVVVAGAGAGGGRYGGGGGAGGFIYTTPGASYGPGNLTVTVGAGGTGVASATGNSGGNSVFDVITATGGGGGGNNGSNGVNGGSGGGSSYLATGGTGVAGQGFAGGSGGADSSGGGGSGGAGVNGSGVVAGNGGVGTSNSINTSVAAVTYACGGGGGGDNLATPGTGGCATAGNGIASAGVANGSNGTANFGGGGGGGGAAVGSTGGNGGSGVVLLRYKFQ